MKSSQSKRLIRLVVCYHPSKEPLIFKVKSAPHFLRMKMGEDGGLYFV